MLFLPPHDRMRALILCLSLFAASSTAPRDLEAQGWPRPQEWALCHGTTVGSSRARFATEPVKVPAGVDYLTVWKRFEAAALAVGENYGGYHRCDIANAPDKFGPAVRIGFEKPFGGGIMKTGRSQVPDGWITGAVVPPSTGNPASPPNPGSQTSSAVSDRHRAIDAVERQQSALLHETSTREG